MSGDLHLVLETVTGGGVRSDGLGHDRCLFGCEVTFDALRDATHEPTCAVAAAQRLLAELDAQTPPPGRDVPGVLRLLGLHDR